MTTGPGSEPSIPPLVMIAEAPPATRAPHDWRLPVLALATWGGALAGGAGGGTAARACWALVAVGLLAAAGLARGHRRGSGPRLRGAALLLLAATVLAGAACASTAARAHAVRTGALAVAADDRAVVDVVGTLTSDPRVIEGRFGTQVVVRVRVAQLLVRGERREVGGTVVVLGDPTWRRVALGTRVEVRGRLAASDDDTTAALLTGAAAPRVLAEPDVWWRAAGVVRHAIRRSVAHTPSEQAGLVPALVDGDDAGLPADLEQDFATTGLTHLTAVSGTNLTLVVGALLLVARWVGVRGRWRLLVGMAGIAAFVLLARTEPSVLRAAAMGVVGLFAFGPDGRRRGLRALGAGVVLLVLVDPPLARSAGFALSTLATAGIVLLGPPLADRMARWAPRPVAEAVAVPTAAQLACTPVVAALSGQVSLVAVGANLLVAPLVGPATVLGLLGGLVTLVVPIAGRLLGTLAGWCVAWLILVARRGADLPVPAIGWGTGALALTALVLLCAVVALVLPRLFGRPALALGLAVALTVVVLGGPGRVAGGLPGAGSWPPRGWVMAMCDVGQGDALVVAAGPGQGIVVDAGPDPEAIDRCLDRLDVRRVPLMVLSHFHADHVDGLDGVLRRRAVAALEVTAVMDPPRGVREVEREARQAGLAMTLAPYGVTRRIGEATVQVLHPDIPAPVPGAGDGSSANDASVVLLVEVGGVRLLLTGDVEPPSQADLARLVPDLDVDVLKLPHHGSSHQDVGWLVSLRAELVLVSVGAHNDYGHPSRRILQALQEAGSTVARTDTDGDLAVVVDGRRPRLVASR